MSDAESFYLYESFRLSFDTFGKFEFGGMNPITGTPVALRGCLRELMGVGDSAGNTSLLGIYEEFHNLD